MTSNKHIPTVVQTTRYITGANASVFTYFSPVLSPYGNLDQDLGVSHGRFSTAFTHSPMHAWESNQKVLLVKGRTRFASVQSQYNRPQTLSECAADCTTLLRKFLMFIVLSVRKANLQELLLVMKIQVIALFGNTRLRDRIVSWWRFIYVPESRTVY